MNRQQIIDMTSCIVCGAEKGKPCTKKGKARKTIHGPRAKYAIKVERNSWESHEKPKHWMDEAFARTIQ